MKFVNEPHVDWALESNREKMRKALIAAKCNFGGIYPILIDGKECEGSIAIYSADPARKNRLLGLTFNADRGHVDGAVSIARSCWSGWKNLSGERRGEILFKAAEIMSDKKFKLAAFLVYEISKTWDEAVGEIEEAIDFTRLYAFAAAEYEKEIKRQPNLRCEKNYTKYISRGITAAISSWNFPFSLLVEKIASSLAAGCPILVKPAEQSPISGWHAARCFLEAGVPPGLVAYLPGGAETGKLLVELGLVTQVTFTGSKETGISIAKSAAGASFSCGFKRVDLETGGNNTMIICPSADLEKAAEDVIRSKFSFNGQKCSALQRLIIIGDFKDKRIAEFIEKLSVESLKIGHPENPEVTVSALIDEDAQNSVNQKIKIFKDFSGGICFRESKSAPVKEGAFVNPIIFFNIPQPLASHEIVSEEIFGPALFVFCADNLIEAVKFANFSEFGLTAGIHSELDEEIDYFVENIKAGNIYVRRPIVGAVVDRQPFGGIKFSGMGRKIGAPERLEFYLDEVSVSKNLLSHGMLAQ